ncbi:hypothetical protein SMF913_25068 [Streptomyces malaysiensis]|uniref:Uncharacterized protein n=1 Tax=Streptomyces malaysiensis TaxID=92644 RepID=A0A2J7YNK8_STRMQ|nr:hypothetical protein SMF913_25068 [Streptomyces malaysiensis]
MTASLSSSCLAGGTWSDQGVGVAARRDQAFTQDARRLLRLAVAGRVEEAERGADHAEDDFPVLGGATQQEQIVELPGPCTRARAGRRRSVRSGVRAAAPSDPGP